MRHRWRDDDDKSGREEGDWGFGRFFAGGMDPREWAFSWREGRTGPRRRWRRQVFESGEMKYVILRLLKEKPRHGYEIIKALEEKMGGWYTPSAGTIYPTLQLLEDQGYVRAAETDGKKVYSITPEGEAFLEEHRDLLDEILERVGDAVRGFAGGAVGEVTEVLGRLARLSFAEARHARRDDPRIQRILEILRRAAQDIDASREKA